MSIRHNPRALVALTILGAVALFAVGFFVALGIRSVVAGPDAAPSAAAPNPGHGWDSIGLPPGTWTGLDADLLDGMHAGQSGTDYIPYADASGNVGIGTTSPGSPLDVEGNAEIKGSLQVETVHGGGQASIDLMPPETVPSPNTPVPIWDNNPIGVTDTITFPDLGIAHKIAVSVDISNSDVADIRVTLTDPSSNSYVLHDGGSSGPQLVTSYPDPTPTVSGDLTTWIGQNPQGDWVLKVVDSNYLNNGIDGKINSWSISIVTGKTVRIADGALQVEEIHAGGQVSIGLMQTETVPSPNTPVGIPDNWTGLATDTITFPDVGIAQKIVVSVDISNSDVADIRVTLTDPSSNSYVLHDGGSSGPQLVTSYPDPTPTVSGDLTTWIGQNPQGNWVLEVLDMAFWNNGIDGQINSWSISVVTGPAGAVQITNGDFVVDGNVGIGTDSPGARLEVSSVMRLTPTDSPGTCDANLEGSMYHDASLNEPCFCDGSTWKQFDGGGSC